MSTDYRLHIKRKCDDKVIGIFFCNVIKNILDGKYAKIIHCEDRNSADKCKFTYEDLESLNEILYKELESKFLNRSKQELMLCCAKSEAAINEIKDTITADMEYIEEELKWQLYSVNVMIGHIQCIVENEFKRNQPAYIYNAKDLLKGNESTSIWCNDIYCEVEAC